MRVETHVIAGPIEGEWCDDCFLPSAFRWRLVVVPSLDPTQVWWAGDVWQCYDCGRQWRVKDYGTCGPRAFG